MKKQFECFFYFIEMEDLSSYNILRLKIWSDDDEKNIFCLYDNMFLGCYG